MGAQAAEKDILAFRKEPVGKKYIPYAFHVTDQVISTINGEYITIYHLEGRPHDTASDLELIKWHSDMNHMIRSIGNEHVRFWSHLHHREVPGMQAGQFDLAFAKLFDEQYRGSFAKKPMMVNDLYFSVIYSPVGDAMQKAFSKLDSPTREQLDDAQAEALESLEEVCSQVDGYMASYGAKRLGIYYRDANGEELQEVEDLAEYEELAGLESGALEVDPDEDEDLDPDNEPLHLVGKKTQRRLAYSSALEWLSFLVNGERTPVPVCRGRIRSYLQHHRPVSSMWGDVIQIRGLDSVQYTAAVEVRDYPEETEPGQFNRLMEADYEFVLTQSFSCMSIQAAQGFLTRQQNALREAKDAGKSQVDAMTAARDDVQSQRFIMGWHHATLHVYADSVKEAQKRVRKARVLLGQCAVVAKGVGLASEAAFYAMLPGNYKLCPRPAAINSWNFLCFASYHNFMTGKPQNNPWGEAVTVFKSQGDTPVFFNWHVSRMRDKSFGKRPPGHTLILGETGAGKTTLLNALITQSTKFDPLIFCFDKDRGMMPMVASLGGKYRVLREGEPTGFQPAQMPVTKANVANVKRLVQVCAETTKNGPLEPLDVKRISEAVDHVMTSGLVPHELRTFTAIVRHIPRPARVSAEDSSSLVELLMPWCHGKEHGWLFDNPRDELNFSTHRCYGWDLTEFVAEDGQPAPAARTPLMMYLMYRVRQQINGTQRVMQVWDEFAQYLDDPVLDKLIKRGLKVDRKNDCIYIFATQEPNDALDSRIGKTVVQQCVTKLLLSNLGASPDDYIKGLKLTQAEFDAMMAMPEGSRQFLFKQGNRSTLCSLDLYGMDEVMSVLSGTPDNADRLEQIMREMQTDDPAKWLPRYFKEAI